MRVINVQSLELQDFDANSNTNFSGYATLSHVWSDDEVSFLDMSDDRPARLNRNPERYKKILESCAKARQDGIPFLWVDTCCIDKSSSAELSEAINSMFRWYRNSAICYAYLADVPGDEDPTGSNSMFRSSRWFKRGWTLQELLAPYEVVFLARDWREIGNKHMLSQTVSEITGIDSQVLKDGIWDHVSIASRFSWASMRFTTRVEDQAYCLFGLFDVNMPLIYGEGEKAFYRLQQEIIKESDDQSIFAWEYGPEFWPRPGPFTSNDSLGFLATSPRQFSALRGDFCLSRTSGRTKRNFSVEKGCIRLKAQTVPILQKDSPNAEASLVPNNELRSRNGNIFRTHNMLPEDPKWGDVLLVVLQCQDSKRRIVIPLVNLEQGEFWRVDSMPLLRLSSESKSVLPAQTLLIKDRKIALPIVRGRIRILDHDRPLYISTLPIHGTGYRLSHTIPPNCIPGGAYTCNNLLAHSIRQKIGTVSPIILFFQHETSEQHLPFAIRADKIGPYGSSVYHLRCRVGPSASDWERHDDQTEHDNDWVGTDNTTFPLGDDRILIFRFRKTPEHLHDFVNISVEDVLSWSTQGKWPLPPRLPLRFVRDRGGYKTTREIMRAVEEIRLDVWNGNDIPPGTVQAHEELLMRIKALSLDNKPEESYSQHSY